MKISVCIPVFAVEKYIERCARSLFEQTIKDDIEFIFVDDCTPDRSIEILEEVLKEYPQREKQVTVLHHPVNRGLVAARNSALAAASGDYIIHCDSDDWVDSDLYEKMYRKAKETEADMVYCPLQLDYGNGCMKNCGQQKITTSYDMINAVCKSQIMQPLSTKMYRKNIALDASVYVPDNICMNEDLMRNVQMLLLCKIIVFVPDALYHYCVNMQSISKNWSRSHWDNLLTITGFLEKKLDKDIYSGAVTSYKYLTLAIAVRHPEITTPDNFKKTADRLLKDTDRSFLKLSPARILVEISRKNFRMGCAVVCLYLVWKKLSVRIRQKFCQHIS